MYSLRSSAERSLLLVVSATSTSCVDERLRLDIPLPPDSGILERAVVGLADPLNHPGLDLGHDGLLELVDHVEGVGRVADPATMVRHDMERHACVPYALYSHLF